LLIAAQPGMFVEQYLVVQAKLLQTQILDLTWVTGSSWLGVLTVAAEYSNYYDYLVTGYGFGYNFADNSGLSIVQNE